MRIHGVLSVFMVMSVAVSCSSGGGDPSYPDTICTPGAVMCFANYLGTCKESGKSWDMFRCGPIQYCDSGSCRTRACTPPGKNKCTDANNAVLCADNGSSKDTLSCGLEEKCFAGACLPVPCDAGNTICEFDSLVRCTGGSWEVEACPPAQACKDDTCTSLSCTPEEARCATEKVAILCSNNGTDWIQTQCTEMEHCVDGFCFPIVADPLPEPQPDAVEGKDSWGKFDLPDLAGLEVMEDFPTQDAFTPGLNQALINGTEVKFTQMHDADWIAGDQMLMINLMSKKMDAVPFPEVEDERHNIEIRIKGIVDGQVGSFACEDASTYVVQVWYRYGKYPQGHEDCNKFDYQAVSCAVVLEDFGGVGGRIKGTFDNVTLDDCMGDGTSVHIAGGVFDVER